MCSSRFHKKLSCQCLHCMVFKEQYFGISNDRQQIKLLADILEKNYSPQKQSQSLYGLSVGLLSYLCQKTANGVTLNTVFHNQPFLVLTSQKYCCKDHRTKIHKAVHESKTGMYDDVIKDVP